MDIRVNDTVMVGSRIGLPNQKATVVDMIPATEYQPAMYRVRFPSNENIVTLTPTPNECWIDAPMIYPIPNKD